MRLVRGTDLQSLIESGPLEPARAVSIVTQIAAALDAAHNEKLIHRDVKPQNILVTPADFAYLVDFGIAEVMGDTRLTSAGMQIGSWAYMAPERFKDEPLTSAIDVYALTCVLYEALTGHMPFVVTAPEALIGAHLNLPPPRPSDANPELSSAFDDVIARGMAKEPDDRYGSAGALARAATRALAGAGRTSGENARSTVQVVDKTQLAQPRIPQPQYQSHPLTRDDRRVSPPDPPPPPVPNAASYTQRQPDRAPWVLPTVIIVSAVLVLAAIGVVIGLLARLNSSPTAAPVTTQNYPGSTYSTYSTYTTAAQTPVTPTALPTSAYPPPLVSGADQSASHTNCDGGYTWPGATGFATHSGRGSADTSCFFANSVLSTYWTTYGNASMDTRTLSAPGAVACFGVPGASCDSNNRANFLMTCARDGAYLWLKCTGGHDAVVYLW